VSEFAKYVDYSLLVLIAITIAIIVFKTIELYAPKLMGAPHPVAVLQNNWRQGMTRLERGLTLLAMIASTAPFVGLAGTLLHIMDALRSMANQGVDIRVISGPIATALVATLLGLASAVPAAAAHALFTRRLQVIENLFLAAKETGHGN
jgi:biopolymer transport protein ExbB/TolQ